MQLCSSWKDGLSDIRWKEHALLPARVPMDSQRVLHEKRNGARDGKTMARCQMLPGVRTTLLEFFFTHTRLTLVR